MGTFYMNPPTFCDMCGANIGDKFYDALVPNYRKRGNICPECFERKDCRTGTGQEWPRKPGEDEYVKTKG